MELLLPPKKRKLSLSCEEEEEERRPLPTKKKARWRVETSKTPAVVDIKNRLFKKFAAAGAAPCRAILLRLAIHRRVFLFEKIHSDRDWEQNRLQVKEGVVESSSLKAMLTEEDESAMKNPKIGLPFTVLDPRGREYRMTLKKLGTRYYRFMGEYHKLVKKNKIKIDHVLDIWGFRLWAGQHEGELRFAMLNYGQEETEEDGEQLTAYEKVASEALLELKKRPVRWTRLYD